eukprot:scaffold590_cov383-Prasinococcus_capsulatus_cf.AAC.9
MFSASHRELADPPSDCISRVRFATGGDLLLASSWDRVRPGLRVERHASLHLRRPAAVTPPPACPALQTLRLYDVHLNSIRAQHQSQGPILDCCLQGRDVAYFGGLEAKVKRCDLSDGREQVLGSHEEAIKCLELYDGKHVVISGSWDRTVKTWDARSPACIATSQQPGKVYSMSVGGDMLVVATSGRRICLYDLRKSFSLAEETCDSPLKYQTRCVHAFPTGNGYALGSVEGRVAMEYLREAGDAQTSKCVGPRCRG